MSVPLSYLGFHALFVLPPIACLGWLASRRDPWGREPLSGIAFVVLLAVVYTTPWDNLLVAEGVWWYGDGAVHATLWHAPVEEHLFFVLQPVLTAFWLLQFVRVADRPLWIPPAHRAIGAACGLSIAALGWLLLDARSTLYLGAILVWAGPVLAVQWTFGSTYLWRVRRQVALAVAVPTAYLWAADRIAIGLGIWRISETYTTGYAIVGLPIEEALFFLVTNVFVVQGLVCYLWLLDRRHELPSVARVRDRTRTILRGGIDAP